ncbi:MAG: ferric reductase-like transmembrane domain-containing protein [Actinomycetes bacterium]
MPVDLSGPGLWYATRASGLVTMLMLTLSVVLGVLTVTRFQTLRWPRFVTLGLHRNVSLLVVVFLGLHIVSTVLDSYTSIALADAFIPFLASYRPLWLGLGAVGCDLLIALLITSLIRPRIGVRVWRVLHWLAYACWPAAIAHGLGAGTDSGRTWVLALTVGCVAAVGVAVMVRLVTAGPVPAVVRVGMAAMLLIVVVLGWDWLRSGPLSADWSQRALMGYFHGGGR